MHISGDCNWFSFWFSTPRTTFYRVLQNGSKVPSDYTIYTISVECCNFEGIPNIFFNGF